MRIAIFLSVGLLSLWACAQSESTKMSAKDAAMNRVELIDFYGTHRCVTCEAIEANARYTVKHFFADAVKEGRLSFLTINVDEEKNYDMAEKFEAPEPPCSST